MDLTSTCSYIIMNENWLIINNCDVSSSGLHCRVPDDVVVAVVCEEYSKIVVIFDH